MQYSALMKGVICSSVELRYRNRFGCVKYFNNTFLVYKLFVYNLFIQTKDDKSGAMLCTTSFINCLVKTLRSIRGYKLGPLLVLQGEKIDICTSLKDPKRA